MRTPPQADIEPTLGACTIELRKHASAHVTLGATRITERFPKLEFENWQVDVACMIKKEVQVSILFKNMQTCIPLILKKDLDRQYPHATLREPARIHLRRLELPTLTHG